MNIKRLLYSLSYEYRDVLLMVFPISRSRGLRVNGLDLVEIQHGKGFKYVGRKYIDEYYVREYKFTYRRRRGLVSRIIRESIESSEYLKQIKIAMDIQD